MIGALRGERVMDRGQRTPGPAELLERFLGNPGNPDEVLSHARSAAADSAEEFPADACSLLNLWGLHRHYIPVEYGGELASYQELLALMRTVARRDLTVAVAHGKTFLGAVCAWTAAEPRTAHELARIVSSGEAVSLGLTERYHGSDLMANEVSALPVAGGYRLDGEKYLINNATRSRAICLLARTDPDGGPRGFSLVLADKRALEPGTYRHLPKVPTLGIRGADISGIEFDGAVVPGSAMIGPKGAGAEIVLKALQITRTMVPALSLGAADQALRLALSITRTRTRTRTRERGARRDRGARCLYDQAVTRRVIGESCADLLAMEAMAHVAARSVHLAPDELSVTSSAVKYLVPTVVDDVVTRLGGLLGPRSYLVEHSAHGLFEKVERDHRIVGVFDGNTMVNLYNLIGQFRALARNHPVERDGEPPADLFDLQAPVPPARLDRLSLVSRRGSSVLGSLPRHARALKEAAREDAQLAGAAALADRLVTLADELHRSMPRTPSTVTGTPPETFETARRFTLLLAASACLGVWRHSGPAHGRLPDGLWIEAALHRILTRLGPVVRVEPGAAEREDALFERVAQRLLIQYRAGEVFSLLPHRTAEGAPC
ncbi:acyl-CoA dehydrogenase family protein [Wenjunlia tyrosinilytica]|uniref:Acyl-CoA dehydrogenase n=1 Tax=Wenjunlia tyrosinilytica TaxID=1544741 RepID=A0A917ZS41_9ACTN|nr:acyl-CoA dehydrogenase family protein [Wenjunlia tyrosinilytica]GGO89044.1 acyl-CoA dehydrogenase [Wenjunlia tyrosinilytica]